MLVETNPAKLDRLHELSPKTCLNTAQMLLTELILLVVVQW